MFYFNDTKYDFWPVYNAIHRFYPIGVPAEMDTFYNSFPGTYQRKKIIAEHIYNNNIFKEKWSNFCDQISVTTQKKVVGTTYGITSCYSGLLEIERTAIVNDLMRKKEIHFFVSLLGPFYTIIGVDRNEIAVENKIYQSTNFLIASPENEYKTDFTFLGKIIEKKFEGYKHVPFSICRQIIDGLRLEYKDDNCTVFDALFNNSMNFDVTIFGDVNYQSLQWSRNL